MGLYLCITPFFPTPDSFRGGYVYDQVKALQKAGEDVVVFKPGADGQSYEFEGVKVHTFKTKEMPSYFFNGLFNKYNAKSFIRCLKNAGIDPNDVEIAHCHVSNFGECGVQLKKLNPKVKVLLQHHDKDPYTVRNGKLAGFLPNLLYRALTNRCLFRKIDLHVCISEAVKKNLLNFPKIDPDDRFESYDARLRVLTRFGIKPMSGLNTIVLYNGVDSEKFYELDNSKRDSSKFHIGCIGNFVELKHQLDLIKAVERGIKSGTIENVKLSFIGSGPSLAECKEYVKHAGLADIVSFQEEMPHDQLRSYYASLDLFVLPSVFEGFGCVCTEAYACGTPYMICSGQGASEYIKDKNLWTFAPGDWRRLSELIKKYYKEPRYQELLYPVDINILVSEFIREIKNR